MRSKFLRGPLFLTLMVCIALLMVVGCKSQPTPVPTPVNTPVPPTATPVPNEILLVDAQGNAGTDLSTVITQFASENSLQFRTVSSISPAEISSGTKIVVFTADPGNLQDLSNAASQTQFVVLGSSSVKAGGNISTIQAEPADMAFMAGYITELLSYDWRAAGLVTNDGPLGDAYAQDFTNGAKFVCGKCNPYYAPLTEFPVVASEPTASDEATWANDAATLGNYYLSAAFVDPAAAKASVINAIIAKPIDYTSVTLITTTDAATDSGITWDGLLSADYAPSLQTLLPQLLAGQGGNQAGATVVLTSVNEDEISPARQDLFKQTAEQLAEGKIIPSSIQ